MTQKVFSIYDINNDLSSSNEKEVYKPITVEYRYDFNITIPHKKIKEYLKSEQKTRPGELQLLINNNKQAIGEKPLTFVELKNYHLEIDKLQKEYNYIYSGQKYDEYCKLNDPYVEQYIIENKNEKVNIIDDEKELNYDKIRIIDMFVENAKKFYNISVTLISNRKNTCINCGAEIDKIVKYDFENPSCECGAEIDPIIISKLPKDSSRITSVNDKDESVDNFMKTFDRYNCTINDKLPAGYDTLYEKLDRYFVSIGFVKGEEVRKMPLNPKTKKRGNTTSKMIWNALSEIKESKFYEFSYFIGHNYWGWEKPNIGHLREIIKNDYIVTQKAFYAMPPETKEKRTSSPGTKFRLYNHLIYRGCQCCIDDFKMAENQDSNRIHNKIWNEMVKVLNSVNCNAIVSNGMIYC